jgi:hypothetical protein
MGANINELVKHFLFSIFENYANLLFQCDHATSYIWEFKDILIP